MRKDKTLQNSTILDGMFPHIVSHPENGGETSQEPRMVHNQEPQMVYGPEPQVVHDQEPHQPTIDEIWEWFGNPDE